MYYVTKKITPSFALERGALDMLAPSAGIVHDASLERATPQASQAMFRSEVVSPLGFDLDINRLRYLGGTSNQ